MQTDTQHWVWGGFCMADVWLPHCRFLVRPLGGTRLILWICREVEAVQESGLQKEISPLNCLPWRQFAELALPCFPQCLWNSSQWELGGIDGLGSTTCAPGPDGVNEMIAPARLKWTKTATRWTPAPFCWFWLFRSTPMASRGQQVRHIFISVSCAQLGSFYIWMKLHWKQKWSESGEDAKFVPLLLTRCCVCLWDYFYLVCLSNGTT